MTRKKAAARCFEFIRWRNCIHRLPNDRETAQHAGIFYGSPQTAVTEQRSSIRLREFPVCSAARLKPPAYRIRMIRFTGYRSNLAVF